MTEDLVCGESEQLTTTQWMRRYGADLVALGRIGFGGVECSSVSPMRRQFGSVALETRYAAPVMIEQIN